MASTPTTRNRLLKQGTGDNTNTWGDQQSSGDFDMIDLALDGVLSLTVSGNVSLSTANFVDDQARRRAIKIAAASSASATITIPAVEKWYLVWNASAFDQIIASSGGGSSVTVKAGEVLPVICDATNVARLTLVIDTSALTLSGALNMSGNKVTNIANGSAAQDAVGFSQMNTAISSAAFSMGSFGVPIVPGNAGQLLTNNGSTASWTAYLTAGITGIGGMTSASPGFKAVGAVLAVRLADDSADAVISAAGFKFTTGRSLTDVAQVADILTGSATGYGMTPGIVYNAFAEVTLTDAATIAVDMSTFINAKVTLGGNRALGNPSNPKVGQTGFIRLIQDGTGSRTLSFGANWKRQGGAPTLTTTPGAIDVLEYQVITSTYILYNVLLNPS